MIQYRIVIAYEDGTVETMKPMTMSKVQNTLALVFGYAENPAPHNHQVIQSIFIAPIRKKREE